MIYLDHAATTRPDPAVVEAMLPYLRDQYLNPSSFYQPAVRVRMAVERARREMADFLHAEPGEIFFTSGGTEADNWALRAAALAGKGKGRHILATPVEHPAVRGTLRRLEREGFTAEYLPVDRYGRVEARDVEQRIRPDTILVTVMYANNETGTLQPVREIGEITRRRGILFHTDAVQAFGHLPLDVQEDKVDLLSASAHKLYGPKGVGLLYVRKGSGIGRLLDGGSQERDMRPGTENVPAILGFAQAVRLAGERMPGDAERENHLRELLTESLLARIPGIRINTHPACHLPGTVSLTFPSVDAETILIGLDMRGICASAGSACSAGASEPSHVLLACGLTAREAKSTVRFSLGRETTEAEIRETIRALEEIVQAG